MRCLLESSMPDPPVKSMPEQPRTPSYPAAGHAGMDATAGLPMRKLQQAGYALSMPMAPVEAPAMAMAPAPDAAPEPAMSPVPLNGSTHVHEQPQDAGRLPRCRHCRR